MFLLRDPDNAVRFKFTVPGKPRGLPRGQHGAHGQVFTSREALSYQATVWMYALQAGLRQNCFADRPVALRIHAFFERPLTKKALAKVKAYPTGKPDRDNIDKMVMDALRHAWVDDSQVVTGGVSKHWDQRERLEIEVHDELP